MLTIGQRPGCRTKGWGEPIWSPTERGDCDDMEPPPNHHPGIHHEPLPKLFAYAPSRSFSPVVHLLISPYRDGLVVIRRNFVRLYSGETTTRKPPESRSGVTHL